MRLVVTLVILLSFLKAYAQKDTIWFDENWNETSKRKATFFRPKPDKVGDLFRIKDYYFNGKIQYIGYAKSADNLKAEGLAVWFYPDGDTMTIQEFAGGIPNGKYKLNHKNQIPARIGSFKDGRQDGSYVYYYPTGLKLAEMTFKDGQTEGEVKTWYRNGQLEKQAFYKNDKLMAEYREFYSNGNLKIIRDYDLGQINGRNWFFKADSNAYANKFWVKDNKTIAVAISNLIDGKYHRRKMVLEDGLEHWQLIRNNVVGLDYYFEGTKPVGTWIEYTDDGKTTTGQFKYTESYKRGEVEVLNPNLFGENMLKSKLAVSDFRFYDHNIAVNGEGNYELKNGKTFKFKIKDGVEKPDVSQNIFLNHKAGMLIVANSLFPDEDIKPEVFQPTPPKPVEHRLGNYAFNQVQTTLEGFSLKIILPLDNMQFPDNVLSIEPSENELIAFINPAIWEDLIQVKAGPTLTMKFQNYSTEIRYVAAYLEKFYLSQHLDFQQVYGRLNSQLFSTTQVDVLSSEADYDVIENFSPPPPMPDTEPIFTMVEELPEFWGGQQELINFLSKTIVYPTDAREKDIGGRVVVQFVIDREGKVRQPEIKRSVYESLDREALRVISAMPPWKPGKQQGKTVNTYFVLPIIFRID